MDNSQNSTVGNTLPLTSSSHSNQIVNKQSILHRWTNNATLIQLPATISCAHSIKSSHSACSSSETRTGSPSEGEKGREGCWLWWAAGSQHIYNLPATSHPCTVVSSHLGGGSSLFLSLANLSVMWLLSDLPSRTRSPTASATVLSQYWYLKRIIQQKTLKVS